MSNSHSMLIGTLVGALVLGVGPDRLAGAQVYKWQDADGKVHYGDRPPAAAATEDVPIRNQGAGPEPDAVLDDEARREKQRRLLEIMANERARKKADREQARIDAAKLSAECARARESLEKMRTATYLYDREPGGEQRIYSHEERDAATRRLAATITKHCR